MKSLGYYNGEYGPLDEMKIPMTDRACYYGDGVYEAAPARNGVIYALDQHVERMFKSASLIRIEPPVSRERMKSELIRMVECMDDGDLLVYWQLSRGTAHRAHPFPGGDANFMMMIDPFTLPDITVPSKCITLEDTRFLHCNIKTINLIPSVMAMQKAKEAGCSEAIFHRHGRVTECSKSNVHILSRGAFITAPADNLILAGIARAHLMEACAALGIPVEERAYTLDELRGADEIITSSSTSFMRRVLELDGERAGGKDTERVNALMNAVWTRFINATNARVKEE